MTKINKLVLDGFKSFAKKTELVFGDNFNCVLGPNGSGKSNIIDAICFVLGRSSAKALRTEKSANLIYNGGKTKKPLKEAEVSIYFDNKDKTFPSDAQEIKITRIVKQSGSSVYKINDEARTRAQILDFMAIAKLDPEGYNIILQGDIIRFVEMSPNERRTLIEEISGISIYEDKKEKAVKELEKVEQKIQEIDIILTERKNHLKELESERDQAIKFKELQEQLKVDRATYINIQIQKKKDQNKAIDEKVSKYKEAIDKFKDQILELKETIAQKKKEIEKINHEIEVKGEKDQVELQKQVENLKVDIATKKSKIESINQELEKAKTRLTSLKENQKSVETQISQNQKDTHNLKSDKDRKQKELELVEDKLSKFRSKHNMDNAVEIEREIDSLDTKSEELQKSIQDLRQEQQEMLREKDRIEIQIESVDEKINKVLELEKENKDQLEKLKHIKTEFKKSTLELNTSLNEDSSLSAQLSHARDKALHTNEELSKLHAKSLGAQERSAGDLAIKEILKQKNKIKGIYGTISELGEVSSTHAQALEVAAGNKIKSIVVENDEVAATCIKYLKQNQLGVATFVPLNKIASRPIEPEILKLSTANGVSGLAVNLVNFDPKFKKAFLWVFGSALIVDNLDVARRVGIGNAKMITNDGDVVERAGAMQGGFRNKTKSSGAFVERELSKKIKELEKEEADLQSLIAALEKRKKENEEKIYNLRQHKANLEGDIIRIEKSLHIDSADMDASKEVKKEFIENLKEAEKKVEAIQMKISHANRDLATNKIARSQLRAKIDKLRAPTLIAELNAFETKKEELKTKIIQLDAEIKNVEGQRNAILEKELESSKKVIAQNEKEIEEFNSNLKLLKEDIKVSSEDLKVKEEKAKEFYKQYKDLFDRRNKLSDEMTQLGEKIDDINFKSRESELKMNAIALENARHSAELDALEKEFEEFKDVKLNNKPEAELKDSIRVCERKLDSFGNVNMKALEVYDKVKVELDKLIEKKDTLTQEKEDVLIMMNEIESKKREMFLKTFDIVKDHFINIFSALFAKGEAELELENPEMPFEAGVRIKVKLSSNKYMDIRSLSGGEKTMTALAFIFAIQEHEPASFYVLDEVDAALDKKNADRLAKLVRKYCDRAQYVVISHNDGVISEADKLYGISMNEHGISKVTTLKV